MLGNLIKKGFLETFAEINKSLENPNKQEILRIVKKERLNISQIAKKVGLSYKTTFAHIKNLEKAGLVKTEKQHKTKGRAVIVSPGITEKELKTEVTKEAIRELQASIKS